MRYEVELTGWVDWQESGLSAGGGGGGWEFLLLPALFLVNFLVWLPHRALGRGYTLHVFDEEEHRVAKERFRTRAAAEAVLLQRQTEGP
ncbi:hypothetical protein [Kineococcus terrestris]|uniref:hypothetical protein n=1 Tax=Kineococcus terrestris TaxID=2044856 RepID=UPI0034DB5598